MNFFQDAASEHAGLLGFGLPQLVLKGVSWFVTRLHLRVQRYPGYGETVRIKTWPKAKKRLFALRDFEMFVGDVRFAAGSTVWCLVDMKTRSPMNVSRTLPGLPENPRDAMVTDFPRICLPENMGGYRTLLPRNSEIDMNGHVNNAVYVNWALETLPSSPQQRDRSVSELLAFFRNEAGIGQEILSQAVFRQREDFFESLHCLTEKGKAREVLRMKLLWE